MSSVENKNASKTMDFYKSLIKMSKEFASSPIEKAERDSDKGLQLSYAQERLWLLDRLEPGNTTYNITYALRLKGILNKPALEFSLNKLVERHESLRTTFISGNQYPVQIIAPVLELSLPEVDLELYDKNEHTERIRQLVNDESKYVFDLSKGPLIRATLIRLSEDDHILLFNLHHIITDGWSEGIIINELNVLYESYIMGKVHSLQEIPIQYIDYAEWQRKWLQGKVLETQMAYWKSKLDGAPSVIDLPFSHPRPSTQSYNGAIKRWNLSKQTSEALKTLSLKEGTTLYMTLLACFNILLCRYSGQEDIVIGTPIAGRNRNEIQGVIGFFVNTLAIRTDLSESLTFRELLSNIGKAVLEAFTYQDLPFEKLVEELKPNRNMSYPPIFQVMFSYNNFRMSSAKLGTLNIIPMDLHNGTTKFDLTLIMQEGEEGLACGFEYCSDLFDESLIEQMIVHLNNIFDKTSNNPDIQIHDIEILSNDERNKILLDFNNTDKFYNKDKMIPELFELQADKLPDKVAIIDETIKLTYKELNDISNQTASFLHDKGIGRGSNVAVIMERTVKMIITVMGILKAGGTYVPMEPSFPKKRIHNILQNLNINCIFTQSNLLDILEEYPFSQQVNSDIICMDIETENINNLIQKDLNGHTRFWSYWHIAQSYNQQYEINASSDDIAYIIHTSGSTGVPKGVMVKHKSVINLIEWVNREFEVDKKDNLLFVNSICFDLSVYDIFGILASGGSIRIVSSQDKRNPEKLLKIVNDESITFWDSAPAALQQLIPFLSSKNLINRNNKLRLIFSSGDRIPVTLPSILKKTFDGVQIINLGGTTETTVWNNYYPINETDASRANIPYGKPMQNTQCYILNSRLQVCPIGVPGDLYIGGECLAEGYVNDPGLTAKKFITTQFFNGINERIYYTGDLAQWYPDGNMEFLGRKDHQVKIRGYRIELGEIESQLLKHNDIDEVIVTAAEDKQGNNNLYAYWVGRKELHDDELRLYLSRELTDYMIPAYFIRMDSLPITSNGKIDRKSLPAPESIVDINKKKHQGKGMSITEAKILTIWEELLGHKNIDVNDNFFEIGGHSLLAVQVVSKIWEVFQVELPFISLFAKSTIAGLAQLIDDEKLSQRNQNDPDIVFMREGDESNKNLFMIHEGSGDIEGYTALCFEIDPCFNCWGIKAERLENCCPENISIEDVASNYIEKIKRVQAEGPYYIIGWCIGGTIAFEITRQLEAANHEVKSLILIDTPSPSVFIKDRNYYIKPFDVESECEILKEVLMQCKIEEILQQGLSLREVYKLILDNLDGSKITSQDIIQMIPENFTKSIPVSAYDNPVEVLQYKNLLRSYDRARALYAPKNKINAIAHFIKADESIGLHENEWEIYCVNEMNYYEILGNHYSIFQKNNVSQLSGLVNGILVNAVPDDEVLSEV